MYLNLLTPIVYNGLFIYFIESGLKLIEVVRPIIRRFRKRLGEAENSFVNMNLYILLNQVGVKTSYDYFIVSNSMHLEKVFKYQVNNFASNHFLTDGILQFV